MSTEVDQKSPMINDDDGYHSPEKKQSRPYLKGAIASLLVLGVGTALYSWGSHSEPVEMPQPKEVEFDEDGNPMTLPNEVEYDADGNPMYLLKDESLELANIIELQKGKRASYIPDNFWTMRTAPGKGIGWGLAKGKQMVVFKSSNGKWMSQNNKKGKPMMANRNAVGPYEKFFVYPLGNNMFAFKAWNNYFVTCNYGSRMEANRYAIGPWEKFYVYLTNDKGYGVRANGETYVALKTVSWDHWVSHYNDKLHCYAVTARQEEKWSGWW